MTANHMPLLHVYCATLQNCSEVFMLQCLQGKAREITTQQGAATAVSLASPNGEPTAYFVGHNATLKIHSLSSGAQVCLPLSTYRQASTLQPRLHFWTSCIKRPELLIPCVGISHSADPGCASICLPATGKGHNPLHECQTLRV